jgi:hypothetical protein
MVARTALAWGTRTPQPDARYRSGAPRYMPGNEPKQLSTWTYQTPSLIPLLAIDTLRSQSIAESYHMT